MSQRPTSADLGTGPSPWLDGDRTGLGAGGDAVGRAAGLRHRAVDAANGGARMDGIRRPPWQPERYGPDARGSGHRGWRGGEGDVDAADAGAQRGGGRGKG